MDPGRVVHATMSTEILRPIPPDSGDGWKLTNRIIGVHENSMSNTFIKHIYLTRFLRSRDHLRK